MDVRLTSVGVDRVRKNARDLCASRKQLGSTAAARLLNIIVRRNSALPKHSAILKKATLIYSPRIDSERDVMVDCCAVPTLIGGFQSVLARKLPCGGVTDLLGEYHPISWGCKLRSG